MYDVQGLNTKSQEPKLPQNIVLQIDLADNTEGIPDLQVCWQLEARDFSNEQVLIWVLTAHRWWRPYAMLVQMTVCRAW